MNKTSRTSIYLIWGPVIALAFLVQSLIPMGYMPQLKAGKVFEVTVCHGNDLVNMLVDEAMQPIKSGDSTTEKDKPSHGESHPCLYATSSTKDLAFQSFIFQYAERLTYEAFVDRDTSSPVSASYVVPYDGRAPPYSYA